VLPRRQERCGGWQRETLQAWRVVGRSTLDPSERGGIRRSDGEEVGGARRFMRCFLAAPWPS
jgi:hypothetical protein